MTNSRKVFADTALTPHGWQSNVLITLGGDGKISTVEPGSQPDGERVAILLPAPVNLHSHAFQRAMAGLTEKRGPDASDSFWTWRDLMYRFVGQITPEQVEAIAALVQMETLEAGFGAVAEFHYLHHQTGGAPYENLAEMSGRICAAAATTGIGLTLLPVLYEQGGCDGRALGAGQQRFGNTPDQYAKLFDAACSSTGALGEDALAGTAPHSLRAVSPEGLALAERLAPDRPIHIHVAEQVPEVEEVLAFHGKRPVEYIMSAHNISGRWCLIHCTQMTPEETISLARSGAVAGLCPITEASLGDGIFDGVRYLGEGGRFGVGSDSNIRISLAEELRLLEYSQRLRDRGRAMLASAERSTGRVLFEGACAGGAQAAGRTCGSIAPGMFADLVALDGGHIDLADRSGDALLDSFIFAGDSTMVRDVWSAGRHVVQDGTHIARPAIVADYRRAMRELKDTL